MVTLGIDLGGTSIKAGILDETGKILGRDRRRTLPDRNAESIIRDTAMLCLNLCESLGISPGELESVGFGSPGLVDPDAGVIAYSANLHFYDVPVRDLFYRYFPYPEVPVFLENDANCAAIAEFAVGAARDYESSITLTLGTGVGVGFILRGNIFIGYHDMAPEVGHMILEMNGLPCSCGRRGCVEQYISAIALKEQTRRAAAEHPDSLLAKLCKKSGVSGKTPFEAARAGDAVGKQVVDTYIAYLATTLSNMVYAYGPEIILVGGGVGNEGDSLLYPLREAFDGLLMPGTRGKVKVDLAACKNSAGIIGSSMLFKMRRLLKT